MKITARTKGVTTYLDIPQAAPDSFHKDRHGVTALVMQPGMKVDAPTAFKITPDTTVQCMKDMSEAAWQHIRTGSLFPHLFNLLFTDADVDIPERIADLLEEDLSVIHAAGLIILLVESRFESRPEVFISLPETYLHPAQIRYLMSVVYEIQKLPLGGTMNVELS
jgi:hypothetical protein